MKASDLTKFIKEEWFEVKGLIAAQLIVSSTVFALTISDILKFISDKDYLPLLFLFALYLVLMIAIYGAWRFSKRPPRNKKNKIGIIISLTCDNEDQLRSLNEDFVFPLREALENSSSGKYFQVIQMPQHIASEITNHDKAKELKNKINGHFVLYGRVRLREINNTLTHVIDMHGVVGHSQIKNKKMANAFSEEFGELLPRKVQFSKENDLLSFQFTSEWACIVIHYILGIAATISGATNHAEELYRNSLDMLKKMDDTFPIYGVLKERIPLRISELNVARANAEIQEWFDSHEETCLDKVETYLDAIAEVHRDKPNVRYLYPIIQYLKYNDVDKALEMLDGMPKIIKDTDGTWHYNVAFLYAIKKDFKKSSQHYNRAAAFNVVPDVIYQVEEFVCHIIKTFPDTKHLLYCLGIFNWKSKGDLQLAKDYFEEFKDTCNEDDLKETQEYVDKWLKEIEIGIKNKNITPE